MKCKRFIGFVVCLVLVATMFAGCSAPAASGGSTAPSGSTPKTDGKVYTLKFAIQPALTDPKSSPDSMYATVLKNYVEKESGGRLKVEIYPAGQLGSNAEVVQGTMSGSVEMGIVNVNDLNNFFKESMILGMPGAFNSMDECNAVINSDWAAKFFDEMRQKTGIKAVNQCTNGFRHFTNSKKSIKTVADAKGLVFRVMQSPVSIKMVEAMGAKAVPIASSEMYVALQNHVVDGQENPIPAIIQNLSYEVQKYLVLDGHFASIMMCIMSDSSYKNLPADLKAILDKGCDLALKDTIKVVADLNVSGIQTLKGKGMEVYEPTKAELDEWHKVIAGPTQEYIKSQVGAPVVDGFIKAIESSRKSK